MDMAVDTKGKDTLQGNENLMRALDRGIDDMEAGSGQSFFSRPLSFMW
ncbi:MAG: hypothetical protein NC398_07710 [Acetatifactor muris]|nr:hypothetical protein [Acetatifactor muris]MCM1527297.1 hypothetical protein [Bacteroides sp.]